jgi:hypothetical protein
MVHSLMWQQVQQELLLELLQVMQQKVMMIHRR